MREKATQGCLILHLQIRDAHLQVKDVYLQLRDEHLQPKDTTSEREWALLIRHQKDFSPKSGSCPIEKGSFSYKLTIYLYMNYEIFVDLQHHFSSN